MPVPANTRTLSLNDDFTPLNVVRWKKGLTKSLSETKCEHCRHGWIKEGSLSVKCFDCGGSGENPRCNVVVYHDNIHLMSAGGKTFQVPSIISNTHHVKRSMRKVPFSRANIFKRDGCTCQYCGVTKTARELELEHVVPRSMWTGEDSPTNWHNIVTACKSCNTFKANRTPDQAGMSLRKTIHRPDGTVLVIPYKRPKQPTYTELILGVNPYNLNFPKEWMPYIGQLLGDKLVQALMSE